MEKCYLGVDIGSISTKGVIIDKNNNIIASDYLYTEGNPIGAVRKLILSLKDQIDHDVYKVVGVGTTGSARKLIGAILNASIIKNEITAHAIGTTSIIPDVRTIFEIGGLDSKIILLDNGIVTDYAMNTLCAAGTGSFLSSQAKRLGIEVEDFGEIALTSKNPTSIAARCTVFAESDLVHKAQVGHKKEDIIAGLCKAVVLNYLNNVGKGKRILSPIVFQGGVSKNIGVVKAFEDITGEKIIVDRNSHLMGALGAAILASECSIEREFDFDIEDINFETRGLNCMRCANNCEIICVYRNKKLIDAVKDADLFIENHNKTNIEYIGNNNKMIITNIETSKIKIKKKIQFKKLNKSNQNFELKKLEKINKNNLINKSEIMSSQNNRVNIFSITKNNKYNNNMNAISSQMKENKEKQENSASSEKKNNNKKQNANNDIIINKNILSLDDDEEISMLLNNKSIESQKKEKENEKIKESLEEPKDKEIKEEKEKYFIKIEIESLETKNPKKKEIKAKDKNEEKNKEEKKRKEEDDLMFQINEFLYRICELLNGRKYDKLNYEKVQFKRILTFLSQYKRTNFIEFLNMTNINKFIQYFVCYLKVYDLELWNLARKVNRNFHIQFNKEFFKGSKTI